MKRHQHTYSATTLGRLMVFGFAFFLSGSCFSQTRDSSYVKKYSKENDVESFSDWHSCRLRFLSERHASKKDFSLLSNSMLYTGFNIDYKWLSVSYGFNVPGTARDPKTSHRDLLLELDNIDHLVVWQAYYKKYNGLLEPLNSRHNHFSYYQGVHLSDIGGSVLLPLNHKTFSYSAARYLGEQQLKPSGSLILSFNPFYHQVKISDSIPPARDQKAIQFLQSSPQWITGAISVGYAYNFLAGQNKWNLSPEFDVGYGVSRFLRPDFEWKNALQYHATITCGYSSALFYSYVTAFYHDFKNRFAPQGVAEVNSGVSLTLGYRVGSFKKKLLHVL